MNCIEETQKVIAAGYSRYCLRQHGLMRQSKQPMSRGQSATMAREYIARRVSNPLQVTVELTRYGAAAALSFRHRPFEPDFCAVCLHCFVASAVVGVLFLICCMRFFASCTTSNRPFIKFSSRHWRAASIVVRNWISHVTRLMLPSSVSLKSCVVSFKCCSAFSSKRLASSNVTSAKVTGPGSLLAITTFLGLLVL